jgi:hypothetical protein
VHVLHYIVGPLQLLLLLLPPTLLLLLLLPPTLLLLLLLLLRTASTSLLKASCHMRPSASGCARQGCRI